MNGATRSEGLTLVLGGTGKTGRRVLERLASRDAQKALVREPRDFADFCRAAAESGVWNAPS